MRIRNACVILGLLLAGSLRGQDSPLEVLVPSEFLRDGELVVPIRNFAVGTPAGDWRWLFREGRGEIQSQEVYICRETESGAEFQVIFTGIQNRLDAAFITGVKKGMRESLVDGGLQIVSLEITESDMPLPGSYRTEWHARLPDGQSLYGYSYLTATDTVFTIQHITPDATEPAVFVQFAGTFRGVQAAAPRPRHPFQPFWGMLELLLVVVCYLAAVIVNGASRRPVINGGTLGAAVVITLTFVLVAIGTYGDLAGNTPPERFGETTGRRIGEALIPLLIAVLISRAHRKRKTQFADMSEGHDGGKARGIADN